MITGAVKDLEARIRLKVRGPRGSEREIEAVIDTGFTGWLTLPPMVVASLGLPWHSYGRGILADRSESTFDIYDAAVVWDRRVRRLLIEDVDAEPLIGMALLEGYESPRRDFRRRKGRDPTTAASVTVA